MRVCVALVGVDPTCHSVAATSPSRSVDRRSSGSAGWITGSSGFVIGGAVRRRRNSRLDAGSFVVVILKAIMGPDLATRWPVNFLQG